MIRRKKSFDEYAVLDGTQFVPPEHRGSTSLWGSTNSGVDRGRGLRASDRLFEWSTNPKVAYGRIVAYADRTAFLGDYVRGNLVVRRLYAARH
jgi:hypothetical protein